MLKLLRNSLLLVGLFSNLSLQAMSPKEKHGNQGHVEQLLGTKRNPSDLDKKEDDENPSKKPKIDESHDQIDNHNQLENGGDLPDVNREDIHLEDAAILTIQSENSNDLGDFAGLPTELIYEIVSKLDRKSFGELKGSCKYFNTFLNDEVALRDMLISKIRSQGYHQKIAEPLCSYFPECMQIEHAITTLKGHNKSVISTIQLHDGNLASYALDHTIRIWDLETGQCIHSLEGHKGRVNSIIQLHNGNLASCSSDHTIKIWDLRTGQCIHSLEGHLAPVNSIIQLSNGNLASCSEDHTIKIWNPTAGKYIDTLEGHTESILSIIQLSNGNLASCSRDNTVRIWDLETGQYFHLLEGHEKTVISIIQLSNGNLASYALDHTIRIWDLETGLCISTLKGHSDWIKAVIQLRNGNLASCSYDKTIRIWNLKTGQCIKILEHTTRVYSIMQLFNGDLASGLDENITIWGLEARQYCYSILRKGEGDIYSIIQLRNGNLAYCPYGGIINICHLYPDLSAQQIYLVLNLQINYERKQSVTLDTFWSQIFDSLPDCLKDQYHTISI